MVTRTLASIQKTRFSLDQLIEIEKKRGSYDESLEVIFEKIMLYKNSRGFVKGWQIFLTDDMFMANFSYANFFVKGERTSKISWWENILISFDTNTRFGADLT